MELEDTKQALEDSLHLVRLTKGRRKAPAEDLDRGDLYFTDSDSEEEQTSAAFSTFELSEVEKKKQKTKTKVQTSLDLLRSDEDNPHVDAEALELIEKVFHESGLEFDLSFASKLLRRYAMQ